MDALFTLAVGVRHHSLSAHDWPGVAGGTNVVIDLRLLGFAPGLSLVGLRRFYPIMLIGFWINAITGAMLVFAYATTTLTNPMLYVKLVFIVLAVMNLRLLMTRVLATGDAVGAAVSSNGKVLAITSLFFWVSAITAGRMMAYIGAFVF